jgi:ergothioneine biosynthesis protein EgtB
MKISSKITKSEASSGRGLAVAYQDVRSQTECLAEPLNDADATVQSMEDASPAKWHLAHVTWFFEEFILKPNVANYQAYDDAYCFLFNSYYEAVGERQPRPKRGMLTRPTLDGIYDYRAYVDDHMAKFLDAEQGGGVAQLVELGLNHEQQHQELLLTDVLHLFAQNPLKPAYRQPIPLERQANKKLAEGYTAFQGGMFEFGAKGVDFCFDCEGPRNKQLVEPFALANAPVTARAWAEFIADGGYETPLLWLSDGWATLLNHKWNAPLYWEEWDGEWWTMTLRGMQPVDMDAPVTHISYYEADAFATWAGRRLASEFELELAAKDQKVDGNFSDSERLRPAPVYARDEGGVSGLYGDVWEWTSSVFSPYRGFKPSTGVTGEYNGKFMSGQHVLRGGSCVTPAGHMRPTYRNFWHPEKRWQFTGLRLAEDT